PTTILACRVDTNGSLSRTAAWRPRPTRLTPGRRSKLRPASGPEWTCRTAAGATASVDGDAPFETSATSEPDRRPDSATVTVVDTGATDPARSTLPKVTPPR